MDESRFYSIFRPGPDQDAYVQRLSQSRQHVGPRQGTLPVSKDKFEKHVVKQKEFGPEVKERTDYGNVLKQSLINADSAVVVDQHGSGAAVLYRDSATGTVGWITPTSPSGGTFFRPTVERGGHLDAGYMAAKIRAAGAGNWKQLDLAKARDPRVPAAAMIPMLPERAESLHQKELQAARQAAKKPPTRTSHTNKPAAKPVASPVQKAAAKRPAAVPPPGSSVQKPSAAPAVRAGRADATREPAAKPVASPVQKPSAAPAVRAGRADATRKPAAKPAARPASSAAAKQVAKPAPARPAPSGGRQASTPAPKSTPKFVPAQKAVPTPRAAARPASPPASTPAPQRGTPRGGPSGTSRSGR